jgi:hypothetical protein
MKHYQVFALNYVVAMAATSVALGQGAFQNLNFEMANVSNPDYLQRVPFANAFPYWQAAGQYDNPLWIPRGPITRAYYNASDMDQMTVGIYDANGPAQHPVFGTYTAYIEADLGPYAQYDVELTQTGLVPASVRSIRFVSTSYSSVAGVGAQLSFSVNGTTIPCSALSVQPTYTQWAADVSAYAGSSAQICFTVAAHYPYQDPTTGHVQVGVGLDNISFSSIAVPEPSSLGLAGVGALMLAGRAWRRSPRARTHC